MSKVQVLTEKNFNSEVLDSTEIVMVKLSASWCGPCKALEPIIEKIAEESSFKVYELDIDDCPNIAAKFGIRGVPTVMTFKEGKVINQHVGMGNKETLLKLVNPPVYK